MRAKAPAHQTDDPGSNTELTIGTFITHSCRYRASEDKNAVGLEFMRLTRTLTLIVEYFKSGSRLCLTVNVAYLLKMFNSAFKVVRFATPVRVIAFTLKSTI